MALRTLWKHQFEPHQYLDIVTATFRTIGLSQKITHIAGPEFWPQQGSRIYPIRSQIWLHSESILPAIVWGVTYPKNARLFHTICPWIVEIVRGEGISLSEVKSMSKKISEAVSGWFGSLRRSNFKSRNVCDFSRWAYRSECSCNEKQIYLHNARGKWGKGCLQNMITDKFANFPPGAWPKSIRDNRLPSDVLGMVQVQLMV
jgi:hypothetical protein